MKFLGLKFVLICLWNKFLHMTVLPRGMPLVRRLGIGGHR